MILSRITLLVPALLMSACANHEGLYEPACIAYQGDRIELQDGRFTWQRYTDERTVDEAGNVVEPFPGFPKTGAYRVSSDKLELVTDDNVRLDNWFVVEHAGQRYLLNAEQHNAFREGGELPKCVLRFAAADS